MLLKTAANFRLSMSGDARIFEIKIGSINNKEAAAAETKQQASFHQQLQSFPVLLGRISEVVTMLPPH